MDTALSFLNSGLVDKIKMILMIVGAVVLGIPAVLRSLELIFLAIPGDFGDKTITSLREKSEKIAEVAAKILPKNK